MKYVEIKGHKLKMPKGYKLVDKKSVAQGQTGYIYKAQNKNGEIMVMKVLKKSLYEPSHKKFLSQEEANKKINKGIDKIKHFNKVLFKNKVETKKKYLVSKDITTSNIASRLIFSQSSV